MRQGIVEKSAQADILSSSHGRQQRRAGNLCMSCMECKAEINTSSARCKLWTAGLDFTQCSASIKRLLTMRPPVRAFGSTRKAGLGAGLDRVEPYFELTDLASLTTVVMFTTCFTTKFGLPFLFACFTSKTHSWSSLIFRTVTSSTNCC